MPPKLKRLPPKPIITPEHDNNNDDELTVGNIRVSASGVQFTGEADLHVPRDDLNLDKLRRVRQLGSGSQGNVAMYITDDGCVFAVKKIVIPSTADNRMRQTVAAELRNIFSERTNDYTVRLYNAFYREGALRLVMEYMDWGNLDELLNQKIPVPEEACAYIAAQMLHALEMLHTKSNIITEPNQHKGLRQIHRDIKPANVLLATDGRVKVADFGIATSAETIGVNSFVGTTTYMSPERIRGLRYSTPSDIWSVGIVVTQIMLGHYPFPAATKGFMALLREITSIESYPLQQETNCSEEAQEFISRCLRQNPLARSTATELLSTSWIKENEVRGKAALMELLAKLGNVNKHSEQRHGMSGVSDAYKRENSSSHSNSSNNMSSTGANHSLSQQQHHQHHHTHSSNDSVNSSDNNNSASNNGMPITFPLTGNNNKNNNWLNFENNST